MVFSSLLFLFAFLALHLIIYYLVDDKKKNKVLLIFSLIFYSWGGPRYLLLLLGDTFASWYFALKIQHSHSKRARKRYMIGECIVVLGLLGIFKYAVFFATNLQMLTGIPRSIPNIVLPIGISFYTFQLLSYVIDVYRNQIKAQPKYWKLLLYSSLFHQCIAGPIVRYETVANEIDTRSVSNRDIYEGVRRFCIGLAKKAVLANGCAGVADALLPHGVAALHSQSAMGLWVGILFYMLQIYLDFSAYSDMAIGMGRMVGFHYLENFNYPYTAISIRDYWRRWHISLSSFFQDYLYFPLGGSRCDTWKLVRNLIIVWTLTGLWHGANWNYILWGVYFLVFQLLERFVFKKEHSQLAKHIYTLLVVYFSWVIFRFEKLPEMRTVFLGMFGIGVRGFYGLEAVTQLTSNLFFLLLCMVACTQFGKGVRNALNYMARSNALVFYLYSISEMITPIALFIVSVLALIGNSYNPFLYFQF